MNKPLFNFVKILVLIFVLFLGENEVRAAGSFNSSDQGPVLPSNKAYQATTLTTNPPQGQGFVGRAATIAIEWAAPKNSILATLFPSTKNCNYVKDKLYQPFSGIDMTFPGADALGFKEVKNKNDAAGKTTTCVMINGGVENLLKILFTLSISIIIILSVINISISGIQYMTEEASGQIKGAAKKRLQNSLIALGLGLLSYTILYTINKQLVAFDFDPGKIDTEKSVQNGKNNAIEATKQGAFSSNIENNPTLSDTVNVGGLYGSNNPDSPYLTVSGSKPSFNESITEGNFPTQASFGSIQCSGIRCSSSKPTVFGYKDGDGTVGSSGDNGIGNASWSTKPGCTYDTGNTTTLGVALPQGFWRNSGIKTVDVKYIGIRVFVNGVFQKVLPVVDNSKENLDFTFAAAKAYLDPTITNSSRLNTSGKKVTFEIIKDFYKTNPKTDIIWISNKSTFTNKIPCNI